MFQFEFQRGFSRRFYIAIAIGSMIAILDFILSSGSMVRNVLEMVQESHFGKMLIEKTNYSISVVECFMGIRMSSLSYTYFFILPLLCAIPYSDSYCLDRTGYVSFLTGRMEFLHYVRSKFLISFLSAGCTAVIPLLLNLVLCMCFFPFSKPISLIGRYSVMQDSVFQNIFYEHPVMYIFLYLTFVFILFGLLNCVSIIAVRIENNSLAAFLTPFAIYYMTHTAVAWIFNRTEWSPMRYSYFPNFKNQAIAGVGFEIFILLIFILTGYKMVKKRDV